MHIVDTVEAFLSWRQELSPGTTIGFTPTMGALHSGHLSHIHELRGKVDVIVASIFVNPAQFGPNEDLDKYPRDLNGDAQKLKEAGCNVLFFPHKHEVYPDGFGTWVTVNGVTDRYEGSFRPDHFRGVTTVVCKLLNIVRPDVMTLGQKDAQQVAVIKKMVQDLNIHSRIIVVETQREPDGLAMSSRNVYLSPEERQEAQSIYQALLAGKNAIASGSSLEHATDVMRRALSKQFLVDYFDIVDAATFAAPERDEGELIGVFAGHVGTTRLIDNMVLRR